ncbi:hypothetical protein DVK85_02895 [Flavobacterium arcticum]|uniref:Lipid/polyisoprenoid-binding YceI-like domain-containing protein n=1 Tax=Flavobacterium arcticum TaxID=1784713 RepID=A0A345H9H1_9FLAO|nr:hypothetical protein [Flavobacterium arcticum]AXG73231.1 hypothetical protein DVK85_02895 [Flavobacterium arcticum]KAF2513024.1 hypothetical protein E0W72_00960 [Flavobacterium arcticum]
MKKIAFLCLAIALSTTYSCKQEKEKSVTTETENQENNTTTGKFSLVKEATKVSFTAYKTTDKVPVGGEFKKIEITNTTTGDTPLAALNGTTFKIPVNSLYTNDATETRDPKILGFFFGVMKNTEFISGTFNVYEDGKCSIDVTLNGKTANIFLTQEMTSENHYTFKGVMNLENWDALNAIASINKACEVLHTGADGVSKTWSEVAVEAQVVLEEK